MPHIQLIRPAKIKGKRQPIDWRGNVSEDVANALIGSGAAREVEAPAPKQAPPSKKPAAKKAAGKASPKAADDAPKTDAKQTVDKDTDDASKAAETE